MSAAFIPTISHPQRNRRVLLVRRPDGIPLEEDFAIDAIALEAPGEGRMLVRNVYLSVDPAQRGWASEAANYAEPVPLGGVMRALAVGQIVQSRVDGFKPGAFVYGWFGWQDYAVVEPEAVITTIAQPRAPLSAYAGPLGINGLTAFIALTRLGRPSVDETVLISTAAGAVGSLAGQIARAAGCRVVGLTGSDDKAARCVERYGYHEAINYKTADIGSALDRIAPDGCDIFFDSVGGPILDTVLRRMRVRGRVIQCGTASIASWSPPPSGPRPEREVLTRRLVWSGFVIFDEQAEFAATLDELTGRIADGSLVYDEDIEMRFEAAPGALARLYAGRNDGKLLIFTG